MYSLMKWHAKIHRVEMMVHELAPIHGERAIFGLLTCNCGIKWDYMNQIERDYMSAKEDFIFTKCQFHAGQILSVMSSSFSGVFFIGSV